MLALGLALAALAPSSVTHAQSAPAPAAPRLGHPSSPWAFGVVAAGGAMASDDQRHALQLGGGGGLARVELRARPFDELGIDWLETDVRASFALVGPGVLGALGGVLDFSLAARIAPRVGDVRPYGAVALGVALTGPLVRPVGTASVGLAFAIGDEVELGPEIDVQHVIQWDGPGESSDAVFIAGAVALTYRPVPHEPVVPDAPEVVVVTEEHVTTLRAPAPDDVAFELAPPPEPTHMEELSFLMTDAVCGPTARETITLLPPVLFEHDHAELSAAGEVAMHDVLARILAEPDASRIVVEGHADATGTSDYNELLAMERAHTVASWLAAHGVDPARLEETGHGERAPLVGGETADALAPNRRVTIRIERASEAR